MIALHVGVILLSLLDPFARYYVRESSEGFSVLPKETRR